MIDGVSHPLLRRRTALADRGTILSVVSWILLVIVISVLIARFAMKLSRRSSRQRLGLDDLFISLAALFSIGQTIAVSIESTHALGQHSWELQPGALLILMKAEYAASMLYVLNMGCGRISLCLLIRKLVPGPVASYTSLGFAGLTALWTVSGILVIAFACSLPTPWLFWITKCIDLRRFINYICITSIVVEVLLMMIPLFVWNIRLSAGRRLSVSCAFLSRLSIVAAVAAQLYFYNRTSETHDMTYHHWPTVLCTQIAQNLSVITACLPCLHPLVISILAGTTTVNTVNFTSPRSLKDCFSIKAYRVNGTSSQSSSAPMNEKGANAIGGDYCHPLATYGLDLSTAHLTSKPSPDHSPSGSSTTTVTKASFQEPENFFNRLIETPLELPRPPTATKRPPPIPESLEDCGILPAAPAFDSDTEGSAISRAGSPSRRPDTEYILDRQKVISVPEDRAFDRGQYWNEYYPPLPSPTMPRK